MNNDIKNAILEGRVMLLLGAGASFGSLTSSREAIPLGFDLAKILCKEADFDYNNESLPMVLLCLFIKTWIKTGINI